MSKPSCHFKQIIDDSCFTYKFVNKKECLTCWKRHRFVEEYTPVKQEYDERMKQSGYATRDKVKRYKHWGGAIIVQNEVTELK